MEMQKATPGTSAATCKLTEPHWLWFVKLYFLKMGNNFTLADDFVAPKHKIFECGI